MIEIINNIDLLRNKSIEIPKNTTNINDIVTTLLTVLSKNQAGICLSANQIGINYRIGVISVEGTVLHFINPVIKEFNSPSLYTEGSLSFPHLILPTERYANIFVTADNIEGKWFGVGETTDINVATPGFMTAVAIQQMVDSMDGITIYDRLYKNKPITVEVSPRRNDYVIIEKDGKQITIKYKKALTLIEQGWKII